jgi:hypothetical protein
MFWSVSGSQWSTTGVYSFTCHLTTACQRVLAATEENHLTYDSPANGLPRLKMCMSHKYTKLYCQCTNFLFNPYPANVENMVSS